MGCHRTDVAGVRAAHAEDAVHSLLLVGWRIDDGHHEVVGRELVARPHKEVALAPLHGRCALQAERAVTAGKQDDGSDRLVGLDENESLLDAARRLNGHQAGFLCVRGSRGGQQQSNERSNNTKNNRHYRSPTNRTNC